MQIHINFHYSLHRHFDLLQGSQVQIQAWPFHNEQLWREEALQLALLLLQV